MANINGTNLAAPIVPFTTNDTFPTHYAKYGKGGYRTVATITEMRWYIYKILEKRAWKYM